MLSRGGPVVLFVGRINWKKGLDRLIRALAEVPGASLVVAGNDEEGHAQSLDRVARDAGVRDRIAFCGMGQCSSQTIQSVFRA